MNKKQHLNLKLAQLEKATEIPQYLLPKIQRVAQHLRDREHFARHYSPRLVSIGPIHYGAKNLQLGEQYKLMWAAMYLDRTGQNAQTLYQKIASNIDPLKELFAEDVNRDFPDDEKLSWMLFVDGCSLLQILEEGKLDNPKEMNVKLDQLVLVWQDVLLLENQLPYQVLKLLSGHDNDAKLLQSMKEFLQCHHLLPGRPDQRAEKQDTGKVKTKDDGSEFAEEDSVQEEHGVVIPHEQPSIGRSYQKRWYQTKTLEIKQKTIEHRVVIPHEPHGHLLHQLRRAVLVDTYNKHQYHTMSYTIEQNTNEKFDMITYRNIQELKAAGIRLKKSNSRRLTDISFSSGWLLGELKLPKIIVDDTTAPTFLNFIAYEMCPDFENKYEICSFVVFMDSLIDHPDDVKELRSVEVLHNSLGSDEEVATLFNTISADLVPDTERYSHIRQEIERHYRDRCKTYIALGYSKYFSNPWAIIAFLTAVFALVLTLIQTWFAINPAG